MLKCNANPDLLSGIKNTLVRTSFFTLFLLFFACSSFAQVGINTDNSAPDASAILDIKSTTKGMLVPRMTTPQRDAISSAATGLLVFDTDLSSFWFYDGTAWEDLSTNGTSDHIADADNDTKIQVEESGDEDKIRFDIDGTEFGYMDGKTFHLEAAGSSLFIGTNAGASDDGTDNYNTFIGIDAGKENTTGDWNTANGYQALFNNTTGYKNTANGYQALYENISGDWNTANGCYALTLNTSGHSNLANGYAALINNTSGSYNVVNGNHALANNFSGNYNTAVGYSANVSSGNLTNATAIGANARVNASNKIRLGDANVTVVETVGTVSAAAFEGDGSGLTNLPVSDIIQDADDDTKIQVEKNGDEDKIRFDIAGTEFGMMDGTTFHLQAPGSCLFIGKSAGNNDDGSNNNNTFIGINAGFFNTAGSKNTAIGSYTFSSNTTGISNTAIGQSVLYFNDIGSYNTAIGRAALLFNTEGSYNTANGYQALFNNVTGNENTAIGYEALDNNTTGNENTALGHQADVSTPNLSNATAIGAYAVVDASNKIQLGDANVTVVETMGTVSAAAFEGDGSGLTNLPVSNNIQDADNDTKIQVEVSGDEDKIRFDIAGTQFGMMDGRTFHLKAAGNSLFLGNNAGQNDDGTGNQNTFIGIDAGQANTDGNSNVAIGRWAFLSNTSGNYNAANGYLTLWSNTTGNKNTANGYKALSANTTGNNNTTLGYKADVGSGNLSNATAIGANAIVNQSNSLVLGNGVNVGIGTSSPSHPLHMGSGAHCTSGGVWTNASDIAKKYDIEKLSYGLEEVLQMKPVAYKYKADDSESIGFIAQMLESIIPEVVSGIEGEKGVAYGLLTSVLVNAIQQLVDRNDQLADLVGGQQADIETLKNTVSTLQVENANLAVQFEELAELKAMIQQLQSAGLSTQN